MRKDQKISDCKTDSGHVSHHGCLLDRKEFDEIKQELARFEERRELAISANREVITLSKQIIYAIHRGDMSKGKSLLPVIKAQLAKLPRGAVDTDMPEVAKQEYVEAATYLAFIETGCLPTRKDLGVEYPPYLSGLCDLTGELVRKAVKDVIEQRFDSAKRIHALVDEIYGAFLEFDLRGGDLRKKSDSIKWNLKKLEDVMYDIELKGRAVQNEPSIE